MRSDNSKADVAGSAEDAEITAYLTRVAPMAATWPSWNNIRKTHFAKIHARYAAGCRDKDIVCAHVADIAAKREATRAAKRVYEQMLGPGFVAASEKYDKLHSVAPTTTTDSKRKASAPYNPARDNGGGIVGALITHVRHSGRKAIQEENTLVGKPSHKSMEDQEKQRGKTPWALRRQEGLFISSSDDEEGHESVRGEVEKAAHVPAEARDQVVQLIEAEDLKAALDFFATLPPNAQTILKMHWDGQTYEEIADRLGCSKSKVARDIGKLLSEMPATAHK
jgi:RNA polymerase sigma factor (sigma-70 family)